MSYSTNYKSQFGKQNKKNQNNFLCMEISDQAWESKNLTSH